MHIRNSSPPPLLLTPPTSDATRRIWNFKKERFDFPAADEEGEEEEEDSMLKVGRGLGGGGYPVATFHTGPFSL